MVCSRTESFMFYKTYFRFIFIFVPWYKNTNHFLNSKFWMENYLFTFFGNIHIVKSSAGRILKCKKINLCFQIFIFICFLAKLRNIFTKNKEWVLQDFDLYSHDRVEWHFIFKTAAICHSKPHKNKSAIERFLSNHEWYDSANSFRICGRHADYLSHSRRCTSLTYPNSLLFFFRTLHLKSYFNVNNSRTQNCRVR